MSLNVTKELAELRRMSVGQLRERFAAVFGEATSARHKEWLVRRIIWRLQAKAEGDLSERARTRACELANEADLRVTAPKRESPSSGTGHTRTATLRISNESRLPLPGTILTRPYKGQTLQVRVLSQGFEYEGTVFKS